MDLDKVIKIVEEGFESAKATVLTKIESYVKEWNQTTSARTHMKLELRNGIAQTILTSEEIKGEGGVPIEVALVDDPAGDVIDAEPEASANVEIVLLKGRTGASEGDDWTAEEFNANIIPHVEGKRHILAGNLSLQLHKGVAVLENISFRNHASKIKPPFFRLGVKVVNGDFRIKEAKTEPFTLKDYRAKYGKKHEKPSLSDKVSRLVCIAKGGKIAERLKDNKICTVEDFLTQLLINPQGLETIVKSTEKNWEAMVNNARACVIGERVYCYMDLKLKTGIIFNLLGHVLGLYSESYYPQTSTLSENQKAYFR